MAADIIPRFPSSTIFCGGTGSGKTTLLGQLLLKPQFYLGFFDKIFLLSPSGNADPSFEKLGLHKDRIFTENFVEVLRKILKDQEAHVKSVGSKFKANRIAVIFEDSTSLHKLQHSAEFSRAFTMNRHLAMAVFCCAHKISGVNRTCRLQAHNIFYFASPLTENKILCNEHCPPGLNNNEFCDIIDFATEPDESSRKPFLHINMRVPFSSRYRKNLNKIIKHPKIREV
jgi:hypothetical protein